MFSMDSARGRVATWQQLQALRVQCLQIRIEVEIKPCHRGW